jgi:ABC-type sugar transport system substrate-binding protein
MKTSWRILNRRTFLVALGTNAFAVPSSSAQQSLGKPPRIGWLVPTTKAEWDGLLEQYRLGMRELGKAALSKPNMFTPMTTSTDFPILQRSWWSAKSI